MSKPPAELSVKCPDCGERAIAVVPDGSEIVEREDEADGKVWVNCRTCDDQFIAYYHDGE